MDTFAIFAVTVAAIIIALMLSRLVSKGLRLCRDSTHWFAKHLILPKVVPETRWLPSLSRLAIISQLIVLGGALLFMLYPRTDSHLIGRRAGQAAIIFIAVFYLGPHLSFSADCLNISLSTMKAIHYGATLPFLVMVAVHVAILPPSSKALTSPGSTAFSAVVAAIALASLLLLSIRPLRRFSYEVYLRVHQILAAYIWFAVWMHIRHTNNPVIRYYFVGIAICFGAGCAAQFLHVVWSNAAFHRGPARSHIVTLGHAVRVVVYHPVYINVQAGQFINLYMPTISLWSCLQSHPFFVTFSERWERGVKLELMVESRQGWTSKLLRQAQEQQLGEKTNTHDTSYITFFSGPHGRSVDVDNYGLVIMIASGWGLMAQIPYLQHLIRGYNHSTSKARRIHLVWQLNNLADGSHARDIFNRALEADEMDNGYILDISIYHPRELVDPQQAHIGRRGNFIVGTIDSKKIIEDELNRQSTSKSALKNSSSEGTVVAKMERSAFAAKSRHVLVMVSASYTLRDQIQDACRSQVSRHLQLVELDYQPYS